MLGRIHYKKHRFRSHPVRQRRKLLSLQVFAALEAIGEHIGAREARALRTQPTGDPRALFFLALLAQRSADGCEQFAGVHHSPSLARGQCGSCPCTARQSRHVVHVAGWRISLAGQE